jgi:NAD(P)-dependent dehydrogenase (short-subunit alcohol dehydrogenase family)
MPKTILVTGAGSGFGESAAIGMAKNGHTVIATVQVSPQVTPARKGKGDLAQQPACGTARSDRSL